MRAAQGSKGLVGDVFINFISNCKDSKKYSNELNRAIEFVTTPSFLSSYGSIRLAEVIAEYINHYPENGSLTVKLFSRVVDFPILSRIVSSVTKLDKAFFEALPEQVVEKVAKGFSFSKIQEISTLALSFLKEKPENIKFEQTSQFVSISDVFNESSASVLDNTTKALQCIEQFQPYSNDDVADFVVNLVSCKSPIHKEIMTKDRGVVSSLLRPFKGSKITIEHLISAFDTSVNAIPNISSFQFFANAIKEVTGLRYIPAAPFLGKWNHKKTQLVFIQHIISTGLVQFPKQNQTKIIPVLTGSFKGEHWKSIEFIEALANLYDDLPDDVNALLSEQSPDGATAQLLVVLAQNGKTSKFAAQLLGNLLTCQSQYMSGISTLWSINNKFLVDVTSILHREKPLMLGRCFDITEDLSIFKEFCELAPQKFRTILELFAFFRRGADFRAYLRTLDDLNFVLQIFERPADFGFTVPMGFERKVTPELGPVSADWLLFNFLDEAYPKLDEQMQKKAIPALFAKCCERTKKLLQYEFPWHRKVTAPASPRQSRDLDIPSLAMRPEQQAIRNFQAIVSGYVHSFPKDRAGAEKGGRVLGSLIARDLLSREDTAAALDLIERGLKARETSTDFIFAREAVTAMKPGFDLCIPFVRKLIRNPAVRKHIESVYIAAVAACMPTVMEAPEKSKLKPTVFKIHPRLERFYHVRPAVDMPAHIINYDNTADWDRYALAFVQRLLQDPKVPVLRPDFEAVAVEAAVFYLSDLIINGGECATWRAVRVATWLSSATIKNCNPSFGRYFNIPDMISYAFEHTKLSVAIPMVNALFKDVPDIFYPPCPWTVSILSSLAGVLAVPYIKKTLRQMIISIFGEFKAKVSDIQPREMRLRKTVPDTDSDYLFPPVDLSQYAVSRDGLYNGDITSIVSVISKFMWNSPSHVVKDAAFFVHSKVPIIAKNASVTAFSLATKDFSRSKDSTAVNVYAKALIPNLVRALSCASVKVQFSSSFSGKDIRFIENLVTMIATHIGTALLLKELEPIRRLRNSCEEEYWDVKAFPPVAALKVPEVFWPEDSQICSNSTTIYGCYSVPSCIKSAYARFSSLQIETQNEIGVQINESLANLICSKFIYDSKGEIIDLDRVNINVSEYSINTFLPTIIACFPPTRCNEVASKGIDILKHFEMYYGGFDKDPKVTNLHESLQVMMPHLRIFVHFFQSNYINECYFEPLLMKFFDEHGIDGIDLSDIIMHLYKQPYQPLQYQRLYNFFYNTKLMNNSQYSELIQRYAIVPIEFRPKLLVNYSSDERARRFLNNFQMASQNQETARACIAENTEYFSFKDGALLPLIKAAFPNNAKLIAKLLFATLASVKVNDQTRYLQSFLKDMFSAIKDSSISSTFFCSVIAPVVVQLRGRSQHISKMFGGFLNDIAPTKHAPFISIWLYLFPLVVPPLLSDPSLLPPSSALVVALLATLDNFPDDWGEKEHFRKLYKAILRTFLLLIHDSPVFIVTFAVDFISAIPLKFRRLRNLIQSCAAPNVKNMPFFMMTRQQMPFEILLRGDNTFPQYLAKHLMKLEMQKKAREAARHQSQQQRSQQVPQALQNEVNTTHVEILHMLIYIWERYTDEKVRQNVMWNVVRGFALAADTLEVAVEIVEGIFDGLRFDSPQTTAFANLIQRLYKTVRKSYNSMSIQDVISAVCEQRAENLPPVPYGVTLVKSMLE